MLPVHLFLLNPNLLYNCIFNLIIYILSYLFIRPNNFFKCYLLYNYFHYGTQMIFLQKKKISLIKKPYK